MNLLEKGKLGVQNPSGATEAVKNGVLEEGSSWGNRETEKGGEEIELVYSKRARCLGMFQFLRP